MLNRTKRIMLAMLFLSGGVMLSGSTAWSEQQVEGDESEPESSDCGVQNDYIQETTNDPNTPGPDYIKAHTSMSTLTGWTSDGTFENRHVWHINAYAHYHGWYAWHYSCDE